MTTTTLPTNVEIATFDRQDPVDLERFVDTVIGGQAFVQPEHGDSLRVTIDPVELHIEVSTYTDVEELMLAGHGLREQLLGKKVDEIFRGMVEFYGEVSAKCHKIDFGVIPVAQTTKTIEDSAVLA